MKLYGVVGWKNNGKTTLTERLVTEIARRGYSVSTVKHAHHGFDIDRPGKDSHRHREAGAREVLVASARRWALLHELREEEEPALATLLARLSPVDLALIEGYKRDAHPKIEVRRREAAREPLAPGDRSIRAIATDAPAPEAGVPVFDLDDIAGIADFILTETGLASCR